MPQRWWAHFSLRDNEPAEGKIQISTVFRRTLNLRYRYFKDIQGTQPMRK